jgi:hypothetical protein
MKKRKTPQSGTSAYYTPRPGTLTYHKPITSMTSEEARTWIVRLRDRLLSKMHRERAYLDRRAARGTHTPTDDVYEQDQLLEQELLGLLDALEQDLS